ncbi:hypothetical protein ACWFRQ_07120 [Streptomyces niveus]
MSCAISSSGHSLSRTFDRYISTAGMTSKTNEPAASDRTSPRLLQVGPFAAGGPQLAAAVASHHVRATAFLAAIHDAVSLEYRQLRTDTG